MIRAHSTLAVHAVGLAFHKAHKQKTEASNVSWRLDRMSSARRRCLPARTICCERSSSWKSVISLAWIAMSPSSLTDGVDADQEALGDDARLPAAASEAIHELNNLPLASSRRRNVSLTCSAFRRTWTCQNPELSFLKVAKLCAPGVQRAGALRQKGSHHSVDTSAHDRTR
jgi:hypothetical protein